MKNLRVEFCGQKNLWNLLDYLIVSLRYIASMVVCTFDLSFFTLHTLTLSVTDLPAYSDTVYSDTPLTVTL